MRKTIFFIILTFFIFATSSLVLAGNIPATQVAKYEVKVKKVEIYNSTTGSWFTLASTPTKFDIASVNAGEAVGNMIAGVRPTDGTYTQVRVTVDGEFMIKACNAAGNQCTSAQLPPGGVNTTSHTLASANAGSMAAASEVTVDIDFSDATIGVSACPATPQCYADGGDSLVVTSNITPITVGAGTSPKSVSVSFDLNNVFDYINPGGVAHIINPGAPTVNIAIE
jgi:hypothetical protein